MANYNCLYALAFAMMAWIALLAAIPDRIVSWLVELYFWMERQAERQEDNDDATTTGQE